MTGQDKNNETKTRKDQMMDSFLDTGTDSMTEWGKEFIRKLQVQVGHPR